MSNGTALHLVDVRGRGDVLGATVSVTWPEPDGGFQTADVAVVGVEKPDSFFT